MTELEKENLPKPPSPNEIARAYDVAGFAAALALWNKYLVSVGLSHSLPSGVSVNGASTGKASAPTEASTQPLAFSAIRCSRQ